MPARCFACTIDPASNRCPSHRIVNPQDPHMRHVPTLRGLLRPASLAPPHRAGLIANVPGAVGMSSPRMHAACTGHVCERLRDGHGVSPRTHAMLVATTRTCEGCHDDLTLVTPDLTLTYRSQVWGTMHFEKSGLTWNAIEAGRFRLALVAQLDPRQAPGGHQQRAGQHRVQIFGRIRFGDGGDTPVAGRARCQGRADRHGYRACMGSIRTTQPPFFSLLALLRPNPMLSKVPL